MSLQVWLPLDGNIKNQGLNPITFTNASNAATVNTNGKIGQCYYFSTAAQRIWSPYTFGSNDTCSIACWFKVDSISSTTQWIFNCGNGGGGAQYTHIGAYVTTNTITYCCGGQSGVTISTPLSANIWYHIAVCLDTVNNKKYLYLNGNLLDSRDYTGTGFAATMMILAARASNSSGSNGNYGIIGYMNDFRFYDHCLSAAEVKEISKGLMLHYKMDISNDNLLLPTPKTYTSTEYNSYQLQLTENLIAGQTYTFQFWDIDVSNSSKTASNLGMSVYWGGGSVALKTMNGTAYFTNGHADYLCFTYTITSANANGNGASNAWLNIYNSVSNVNGSTKYMHIGAWKVEKGSVPTPWRPSNTICDCSGYERNGTITGTITGAPSRRYSNCAYVEDGTSNYIQTPTLNMPTDAITLNIWFKTTSNAPKSDYHMIVDSIGNSTGRQHYEMCVHKNGLFRSGLFVNGTRYADNSTSTTGCDGNWHMLTLTYDGATVKRYYDGVMEKSTTVAISTGLKPTATLRLFKDGYSTYACVDASLSDFRIYCTALTDDDILKLYKVSAQVDKSQNLYAYEFNEFLSNGLTKSGIFQDNTIEPYLTLPDGSKWQLMLYHKVDQGTRLFTQNNATFCNDYGLYSRLAYINNFKYTDTTYEFYVIQDGTEFRWTQTSAPTASSTVGLTTVSGYTNPVYGLAKGSQTSAYLGYNSWWGACGSWTSYTVSGKTGIPGFGGADANGVCTDYLMLYARITKPKVQIANQNVYAETLIEL